MQEVYDQIAGTAKTAYIDDLLDHLGSVYSVRHQQVSHRLNIVIINLLLNSFKI